MRALYSVSAEEAARHVAGAHATNHRRQALAEHARLLWGRTSCDFVECRACRFAFASPFVAADARFYDLAYTDSGRYPDWKWEFEITLRAITALVENDASRHVHVLEIGAGNGAFARRLAGTVVPRGNVTCTEHAESNRRLLQSAGIRCVPGDLGVLREPRFEGRHDVVCMFQVLEHLDDPDFVFDTLSRVTKTGASVFVAVPNPEQRRLFDAIGVREDVPPTHIARWSRQAIATVGIRHGFAVTEHLVEPHSYWPTLRRALSLGTGASPLAGFIRERQARWLRLALKAVASIPTFARGVVPVALSFGRPIGVSQWTRLVKIQSAEHHAD